MKEALNPWPLGILGFLFWDKQHKGISEKGLRENTYDGYKYDGNGSHIYHQVCCTEPVDMRKSFEGLSAMVKNKLAHNPLSGHYFVFINRCKTQMKVLYFEPSGYCLWSKRLEQGQFCVHPSTSGQQSLTPSDLQLIPDGIEVQKYRQVKRYRHAV
ncbi:MAG: IS66 family insertion sequence element accessory protein TnpB [Pontibacterium sp.]